MDVNDNLMTALTESQIYTIFHWVFYASCHFNLFLTKCDYLTWINKNQDVKTIYVPQFWQQ